MTAVKIKRGDLGAILKQSQDKYSDLFVNMSQRSVNMIGMAKRFFGLDFQLNKKKRTLRKSAVSYMEQVACDRNSIWSASSNRESQVVSNAVEQCWRITSAVVLKLIWARWGIYRCFILIVTRLGLNSQSFWTKTKSNNWRRAFFCGGPN